MRSLAWEWETHRELIPPKLTQALSAAEGIGPAEFDEARRAGKRARVAAHDFFKDIDAVITFSAPGPAPEGLASTGDAKFNRLWTLLGVPCVNVPGSHDGARAAGRRSSDRALRSGRSGARGRGSRLEAALQRVPA